MIRLQSVSKAYGSVMVVEDLSFEVPAGSTLCLIGSSGSGKSTTLRMLNRLIEPSSGLIEIQGENILKRDPVRLRRSIGYVIQQIGLFPHLSIERNISLLLEIEGWQPDKIRQRVEELMALVQLEPALQTRYPHQLSGGQQQRVGVARALALNPPIILLDEPFAALDPLTRAQLQDSFLALQKRLGITAVMVTHDLAEAFKCGDKIALMEQGKLVQIGTPRQILHSPANQLVAQFVKSQAGLEQLLDLPVGKLAIGVDETLALDAAPELNADAPLRQAIGLLMGSSQPGLRVRQPDGRIDVLLAEEIRRLL